MLSTGRVRVRFQHLCHTVEMARWMAVAVAIVAAMSLDGCGGVSGSEPPTAANANLIACQAYQTQISVHRTVTTVTTATSFDTIHAMERALAKADSQRLRRDGAVISNGSAPDIEGNALADIRVACNGFFPDRFASGAPAGSSQATGVLTPTSAP